MGAGSLYRGGVRNNRRRALETSRGLGKHHGIQCSCERGGGREREGGREGGRRLELPMLVWKGLQGDLSIVKIYCKVKNIKEQNIAYRMLPLCKKRGISEYICIVCV